jgi:hypothetical protein
LSGIEVARDGVVAGLEADAKRPRPEVALPKDERDRVDDLPGDHSVPSTARVVGYDDDLRLASSVVDELATRTDRDGLGTLLATTTRSGEQAEADGD